MNRLSSLLILLAAGGRFDCKTLPGGRFDCHNVPVMNLLAMAFADKPLIPEGRFPKIKGAPNWAGDPYDIDAIAEGAGEMTEAQVARPLFALLQERFGLGAHLETARESGFSLTKQSSAANLKPSAPDAVYSSRRTPEGVIFTATTMQQLAAIVGNRSDVGATVIDNTGLTGKYDFTYQYNYAPAAPSTDAAKQPEGGNSAVDALEKLGLRLVPNQITVSVIVIEQIHRPTPN
jgi:uncharacterized protein (TIGR03435 family)